MQQDIHVLYLNIIVLRRVHDDEDCCCDDPLHGWCSHNEDNQMRRVGMGLSLPVRGCRPARLLLGQAFCRAKSANT
jgi:hypothetical protein